MTSLSLEHIQAPRYAALARPTLGYVFLISCGLTGDLVLQQLLNRLSGVCIRGENDGLLTQLVEGWSAEAQSRQARLAALLPDQAKTLGQELHASDALGRELAESFAASVLAPPEGTRLCGFREIRYLAPDLDLESHIAFLQAFFPQARFVFCLRDPEKTARTGWWANHRPEDLVPKLAAAQARFADCARRRPDRSILIDYDAYRAEAAALRPLHDLLGLPFDAAELGAWLADHAPEDL
ncbi:sulfotransferase [Thalassococcus sp. S3]|uniref:sulfotransferase n=1 Tax=Thalassococcus sp. S3 TaxID=2017482 RepID=UPI001023F5AF|nr:sulfotransferase [Thalassococcus sp. S3]QBF34263.1 hypothetical protein CFI11_24055 [Thalassococcus sp. S3]